MRAASPASPSQDARPGGGGKRSGLFAKIGAIDSLIDSSAFDRPIFSTIVLACSSCSSAGDQNMSVSKREGRTRKYGAHLDFSPCRYSYTMTSIRESHGPICSSRFSPSRVLSSEFCTVRTMVRGIENSSSPSGMLLCATRAQAIY